MLAILTTHPIQYQVPIWKALAERGNVPFKVYYMSDQGLAARYDPGFGRQLAWDIDLVGGYEHEFIQVKTGQDQGSFWWLRLDRRFADKIKADGATILWTQGWQVAAYWQAVWLARSAGLRTWLRAETNLKSTGRGWTRLIKEPLLGGLLARIDRFLCIGEANRRFYLSRGIAASRLALAPYCVDNARFARESERLKSQRSDLRAKWNVPEDAFCVLFVGKLVAKKRPLDVVTAVAIAQAREPDRRIHVLFVGTGELLEQVRISCHVAYDFDASSVGSATEDGTDGRHKVSASLAGFLNQQQIAEAYVAADCLVLPSEGTETWGLVVNEAMACGLPAVVSDACGCSDDLVVPFRPDLCFEAGNSSAFANALLSCIADPPSAVSVAAIIEKYDVLRTVEAVEALYAEMQTDNAGSSARSRQVNRKSMGLA